MYELGIRDAIRKPVVPIAAKGTMLPYQAQKGRIL
jgi:hypothetical protein